MLTRSPPAGEGEYDRLMKRKECRLLFERPSKPEIPQGQSISLFPVAGADDKELQQLMIKEDDCDDYLGL
jgi:hypothetical protein